MGTDADEILHHPHSVSSVNFGDAPVVSASAGASIVRFPPPEGVVAAADLDNGCHIDLEMEEEESDYSDEGIAGIDIPENILLEDLVFADNITSCNKVKK